MSRRAVSTGLWTLVLLMIVPLALLAQLADTTVNTPQGSDVATDLLTFGGIVGALTGLLRRTKVPNEWITIGMPIVCVPLFMWVYGGWTKEGFIAALVAAAAALGVGAATDPTAVSDVPAKK